MSFLQKIVAAPKSYDSGIYKELKNESYGSHSAQRADIYLPANRSTTSTKVLLLLHGGAWNAGDKTYINDFVKLLQNKYPELAIVNANYRLVSPASRLPEQLADIRQLLDYVTAKSSDWGISNSRFALGGISAGAHLALLYAYKYDTAKKVAAVVSIVGPTYFLDPYYTANPLFGPVALNLIGKPLSDTATYLAASPAHIVTASAPPTYMAYGGYDPLVPASNATLLDQKLTALKVPHQYQFFATEGHRFSPTTYEVVSKNIVAFLKKYSLPSPSNGGAIEP